VDLIKDEKVKIQKFLSGLPSFYKDKIQFDERKTLEESMRNTKYLCEKNKGRPTSKKFGKIRREARWIKERKASSYLSSGINLEHINKDK